MNGGKKSSGIRSQYSCMNKLIRQVYIRMLATAFWVEVIRS